MATARVVRVRAFGGPEAMELATEVGSSWKMPKKRVSGPIRPPLPAQACSRSKAWPISW